ncbi:uridine kinase family protein [Pedobacter sp. MR2016-24]|uniref:uridine kinase family protein n=1 Tax=Pedobacter sp. MR2016-24 TaxID=2994466 RepID=UPI002247040B|nr:uridine kinase [Pedobacter sp. MR2016-24]MCX2484355.1 uridine kinase [Pedobacter sp. MR2016-24]MDO7742337.1 uridine kinase [Pedobacter sp.]
MNNNKPYIIGIAGGSGSGKTFFLKCFLHHFSADEVCLISQDDYYRPVATQKIDENGWINFDLPEGIADEKLLEDLKLLMAGNSIERKEYTFNTNEENAKLLNITSAPIIIVEGLFVFHYPEIAALFDLKIFMDADEEITLNRRISRDEIERGYTRDMVMYQWVNHVMPAYKQYLLPYKGSCQKVIMNNKHVADDIIDISKEISDELKETVLAQ